MAGTISSLGVGSGLELRNMLEQLRQNEEKSFKTPLENKKARLNEQVTAFNALSQKVLEIRTDALNLGLNTSYMARKVNVGNSSVVGAQVSDGTAPGSHQVSVTRLATKSSWISQNGVSSADSIVSTSGGTFSFKVGNGNQIDVSVAPNTTLKGLADAINSKNAGVTASVINTGDTTNPFRLAITANNTGESSRITIVNQLTGFQLNENQGAGGASLNAELTVNGVTYQRNSNSGINDIIAGVTLNLNSTGVSTVEVTEDRNSVKDLIKGFVDKFNSLVSEIRSKTGYTADGKPGLLTDVSSIRGLRSELTNLMSTKINVSGNVKSMIDLGVSVNRDGTITVDEGILNSAIQNNYEDVKKFFIGDNKTKGFADTVADKMNSLTRLGSGVLAIEESNAKSNIQKIDLQLESVNNRLNRKFSILERQFQQLDSFMSTMKSLGNYLTRQFDSLSGMVNNKK